MMTDWRDCLTDEEQALLARVCSGQTPDNVEQVARLSRTLATLLDGADLTPVLPDPVRRRLRPGGVPLLESYHDPSQNHQPV